MAFVSVILVFNHCMAFYCYACNRFLPVADPEFLSGGGNST